MLACLLAAAALSSKAKSFFVFLCATFSRVKNAGAEREADATLALCAAVPVCSKLVRKFTLSANCCFQTHACFLWLCVHKLCPASGTLVSGRACSFRWCHCLLLVLTFQSHLRKSLPDRQARPCLTYDPQMLRPIRIAASACFHRWEHAQGIPRAALS